MALFVYLNGEHNLIIRIGGTSMSDLLLPKELLLSGSNVTDLYRIVTLGITQPSFGCKKGESVFASKMKKRYGWKGNWINTLNSIVELKLPKSKIFMLSGQE